MLTLDTEILPFKTRLFNEIIPFSMLSPSRDPVLTGSVGGEEPATGRLRGGAVTVLPRPRLAGPGGRTGRGGRTEGCTLAEEESSLSFTWEG